MCWLIAADCAVNYLRFAVKADHNRRMNYGDYKYIWQAPDWPKWQYDLAVLAGPMAEVSRAQGLLLGRLADVGAALRDQASLVALTEDVVKTSEIEGEQLNVASVRSSIARRLGAGRSPRRRRGRDGARCDDQLSGTDDFGALVRLACGTVSNRVLRACQDPGRRLAG